MPASLDFSTLEASSAARELPTRIVGILGGMGPAAGADFVRLFVQACADRMQQCGQTVNDQAFPEHWLMQVPVPDRTQALNTADDAPLEVMSRALGRLETVGVCAVAITCNTAHAWHDVLQARIPQIELLHMPREVVAYLRAQGVREVGLMATGPDFTKPLWHRRESLATCPKRPSARP